MIITIQHACAFVALLATLNAIYLLLREKFKAEKPWIWKKKKEKEKINLEVILKELVDICQQENKLTKCSSGGTAHHHSEKMARLREQYDPHTRRLYSESGTWRSEYSHNAISVGRKSSMLAKYGFRSGTDYHRKVEELLKQKKMNREEGKSLEGCKSIW